MDQSLVRIGLPALLVAVFTVVPGSLHAQSLTLEYGWTQSGIEDVLERPNGFGASIGVPVAGRFSARISVRHHTESLSIRRSPCTGLVRPGTDCSPEPFEGDARLTTVGAGVVVDLPQPASRLKPRLYAMGLIADVDVTFRATESDERVSPITPDDPSVGLAGGGSLTVTLNRFVGIKTRFGAQYVRFGTCGTDAWFPFCESQVMPQVSLGAELRFSELLDGGF